MRTGQYLEASDRRFRLDMQTDGNLVEYVGDRALWASNTAGNPEALKLKPAPDTKERYEEA